MKQELENQLHRMHAEIKLAVKYAVSIMGTEGHQIGDGNLNFNDLIYILDRSEIIQQRLHDKTLPQTIQEQQSPREELSQEASDDKTVWDEYFCDLGNGSECIKDVCTGFIFDGVVCPRKRCAVERFRNGLLAIKSQKEDEANQVNI